MSDWFDNNVCTDTKTLAILDPGEDEDIEPKSVARYIKALHVLDRIKPSQTLNILLNSRGGYVEDGLALYSAITACQSYVHIHVVGVAESMATVVLQAGDKRTMSPTSHLMLHEGTDSYDGHPLEIERKREHGKWLEDRCLSIYLERIREVRPKQSRVGLQTFIRFDRFLYKEAALKWGLVDG